MERTASAGEVPDVAPSGMRRAAEPYVRQRAATGAVLAAVLLGIVGDALLRAPGPGINLPLWAVAAIVATVWVSRLRHRAVSPRRWALVVPLLFFAGVFAWRSAPALLALNLVAMLSAFGLLAIASRGNTGNLARAGVIDFAHGALNVGLSGAVGMPILIAGDRALADGQARPRWRAAMAIARGTLIAIPVLVVFGALLTSADARFERLVAALIHVDFPATIGHIMFAGFIAWIAGGYLRAAAVADEPLVPPVGHAARRITSGLTELVTVFGLVDALFLLFVAVQLPRLFGGLARVQQVEGLTIAEYARGGFFELVTVAALVLPLLVAGAALVREGAARDWRIFRGLATGMIALVGLMIASALQRLALYVATFGLSEQRVYATAVIVWLAIVFALFAGTILRRRGGGFAFASVLSGWVVLAALDVANPQAWVVGINAGRVTAGRSFDWSYAAALGPDAVPALATALPRLDAAGRCAVAEKLASETTGREARLTTDWRSWNLGRTRALAASRAANPRSILVRCPVKPAAQR